MRLAVFCWEFPPRIIGGLGTYASEIVPTLVKLGHEVTLFTLNDGRLKTRELVQGVDVHRPVLVDMEDVLPRVVPDDLRSWGPGLKFFSDVMLSNVLSAAKLVNEVGKLEHREFDLVVAHDWLSIMGGVIAKRELTRKLVFHVHSTERGRSMGNGSNTVIALEELGGQRADGVVTVSFAMRDELISSGFPEEKVRVVYNGVDAGKYDPERFTQEERTRLRERYGLAPDELMILFVGRIVPVKGVDRLVHAMKHVVRKIPKAKLVVVGTSEMQDTMAELARTLGVQESVKFRFEFISEEERILHYAATDVCAFPSLYEPFGIVALEAMSMKRPVVIGARGVSGMREFVSPTGLDQAGYHVNPYDPEDIAWGIASALEDENHRRRLGENGRRTVLESFTWTKVAENTVGVYRAILDAS